MSAKINESDLSGKKFGLLTIQKAWRDEKKKIMVRCICECGRAYKGFYYALRQGHTKSCGCLAFKVKPSAAARKFSISPPKQRGKIC